MSLDGDRDGTDTFKIFSLISFLLSLARCCVSVNKADLIDSESMYSSQVLHAPKSAFLFRIPAHVSWVLQTEASFMSMVNNSVL